MLGMHVQTAKRWQSRCRYHSNDSSGKTHHSPPPQRRQQPQQQQPLQEVRK